MTPQPSHIRWADISLKKSFYALKKENPILFKKIERVLDKIEEDAFCSTLIPKRLFPKRWKQYHNLWKYDLSKKWRLFYTVVSADNEIIVLSIVLDWMVHKEYERLFKY